MALPRRGILSLGACFGLGALAGLRLGLPAALGPGSPRPVRGRARALVDEAFDGLDRSRMWDAHVHVVGLGVGDTGCWVNPEMTRLTSPWRHFKFDVYRHAAGITDLAQADRQYLDRLLALARLANPDGKLLAFAFDYFVDESGEERPSKSEFHVPNEYVLGLARRHPELLPCVSIHPHRPDAVERLDRAAASGAIAVKWLPNAMGIDPSSSKCDPFYERLQKLGIPLISHAGEERAVHSPDAQELGNPLRLRRPLERGVRVVVAHAASLGTVEDLDAPERLKMKAFDAFMRLFSDKRYDALLFADVSAVTQVHRLSTPLRELLISKSLHSRLLNGSDYPLPCIDPLISTRALVKEGFLQAADRPALNEIYAANPLLFDFVVKRRVSVEYKDQTHSFSPSVFETARFFQRATA
jgi:predicted TIM-barrel fold metal-dependent hydrolase